MGDLTKNISRHELKCQCGQCDYQSMDYATIMAVQEACDYFAVVQGVDKVVLQINSAARCFNHNRDVGSNDNSQHPRCNAIDHVIAGVFMDELAHYYAARYPNTFGIGLYENFVHLDSREEKARWGF